MFEYDCIRIVVHIFIPQTSKYHMESREKLTNMSKRTDVPNQYSEHLFS